MFKESLKPILLICLQFILINLYAQKRDKTVTYIYDESSQPTEMVIDISDVKAEIIKIDPKAKYLETKSTYTFKVLRTKIDSLVFYSSGIKINKLSLNGKETFFRIEGDRIIIYPEPKLEWHKEYSLYFETSNTITSPWPVFTGWDDETNTKRKQIWGLALSKLIPDIGIKHDLMKTGLKVTFDSRYQVFSNGERLMEKVNKDGTTTWHYQLSNVHNFYLLTLIIGDYQYESFKTNRGLRLEYWYYSDKKECFEPTYRYSKQMFDYLESEFGLNYPWELYRQAPVIDCPFGGMETTTATIYNEQMQCDARGYLDKNYVNVNIHELVHQWFGDYNSYTNGQNIWTSESFATYYAKKFEQKIFGEDHYQKIRSDELKRVLDASIKDDYPVGHGRGGVPRWYPKGSLVLDMLRYVMGENEFKYFINYYLHKHQYAVVEWNDLKVAAREATGMTIDWFLDQWIHQGGEPEYKVSYKQLENLKDERNTHIFVNQIHQISPQIGYFKMPLVFEVNYKDGTMDSQKAWIEKEHSEVIIPNNEKKEIAFVVFDPNRMIIKKINFNRTFEELTAQLLLSKNMIDRYDALLELKKIEIDRKREILIHSYKQETFHLVKSEIIAQLAEDVNIKSLELIRHAINDKDVNVRKAVVANITKINESLREEYEKLLTDSSYQVITKALDNLVYCFPERTEAYLETTKNEWGATGIGVRIKWLEIDFLSRKENKYIDELAEYANINRYESYTVMNAIQALKRLNYLNEKVLKYIFEDATYWNNRINQDAKDALAFFYEQNQYRRMIKEGFTKLDSKSKNAISDIIK
jgi:aminopeptidase N